MNCLYQRSRFRICGGRLFSRAGSTRGPFRTYCNAISHTGASSRPKKARRVKPISDACFMALATVNPSAAAAAMISGSSSGPAFTMSGGIDWFFCIPSWSTCFPLFYFFLSPPSIFLLAYEVHVHSRQAYSARLGTGRQKILSPLLLLLSEYLLGLRLFYRLHIRLPFLIISRRGQFGFSFTKFPRPWEERLQ